MAKKSVATGGAVGNWVTINGAHVLIGANGKIAKGPAKYIGSTLADLGGKSSTSKSKSTKKTTPKKTTPKKETPKKANNTVKKAITVADLPKSGRGEPLFNKIPKTQRVNKDGTKVYGGARKGFKTKIDAKGKEVVIESWIS